MKKLWWLLLLLAPVALELVVRASGYSAPFWYRPDAQLGWTLRPGTQGWFIKEGRSFVQVNAAGFRDRDHALDKPEDVFRVAILGDEHSEAMQVELADSWWSLLGSQLEGCSLAGGRRVEVLNFGVTGYGTAQELAMLESAAMRYQPDLVLLQFSAGNDPQNNSFALAVEKERPFYRLDARGVPRIDDSFNATPKFGRHASPSHELARRLADRSRAVQWLSMLREYRSLPDVQQALLGPPKNELWEEAWRISEALILRMDDYVRRNGARFGVVIVPATPESSYGERRVGALAAKQGIKAVAVYLEKPAYYRTRWNRDGQRAAAELIASTFCGSRERRLRIE